MYTFLAWNMNIIDHNILLYIYICYEKVVQVQWASDGATDVRDFSKRDHLVRNISARSGTGRIGAQIPN